MLTFAKAFHHHLVYFLVQLNCSSCRMMSGPPVLCQGAPARRGILTWCSSPIHAIILKSLIQYFHSFEVLVNFRLHNHQYFVETSSLERLPPKAEEFFPPMRQTMPMRQSISIYLSIYLSLSLSLSLSLYIYIYIYIYIYSY